MRISRAFGVLIFALCSATAALADNSDSSNDGLPLEKPIDAPPPNGAVQEVPINGRKWDETLAGEMFLDWLRRIPSFDYLKPPLERGDWGLAEPPADNNSDPKKCGGDASSPSTSNPVILATGEKYKHETDFVSRSEYGISLTRTYRSKQASGRFFGANWPSSLDYPTLVFGQPCVQTPNGDCVPPKVTFKDTDGTQYTYNWDGYTDDAHLYTYSVAGAAKTGTMTFVKLASKWYLKRDDKTYWYTNGGYIESIGDKAGAKLTYTYTGGNVTKITNSAGEYVDLTWTGGRVTAVRDPAGNSWGYQYDANGMLWKVTSPGTDPDIRQYHYESTYGNNLLTGITINGTRYSTYSYDSLKRVKESGLATGEEKDTFVYATNKTTVTDSKGQTTVYNFISGSNGLRISSISASATASCPLATAKTFYDANGFIDYTLDWNNNKTDYTFDSAGRLAQVTTAAGTTAALTTVNTWTDDKITQVEYRNRDGTAYARTVYTYNTIGSADGRMATATHYDLKTNKQQKATYDYTFHSPSKTIASRTITRDLTASTTSITTITYDGAGHVASVTNGAGHLESWSGYNGLGQPQQHVDINGVVTTFGYDTKGNLTSTSQQLELGQRVTIFTYNHNHQLTDVRKADGGVMRYRYDAAAKLSKVGDASSNFSTRAWDIATNTETWQSPRNVPVLSNGVPVASAASAFVSTVQFDSRGRPWVSTGNNGQEVTFTRDGNGNVLTRTDVLGRQTKYEYDAQNRIDKITMPDTGVIDPTYDKEGRVGSVKDPRGLVTSYTYDGWGRVLTRTSPDTGTTTYTYDLAGRLATEKRNDGTLITYGFDKIDRLRSRSATGLTETYTYDENAYGKGHLTSVVDATGGTSWGYDAAGELVSQVSTIDSVHYTTIWDYDTEGRLLELDYPTGMKVAYTWDTVGRIKQMDGWVNGQWQRLADNFLYEPVSDRPYAWRHGNGLVRMVTVDNDGRVSQLQSPGAHGLSYGWNTTDTIQGITDSVYSANTETFTYDPNDRLKTVTRSGDNQSFTLDKVGNRTAHTRAGVGYTITLDTTSNQLLAYNGGGLNRGFSYNDNGDVSGETRTDGNRVYGYDPFGRLTGLWIGGVQKGDYGVNALNQRAVKNYSVGTVHFLQTPGGQLLAEFGNVATSHVWFGGELLGMVRSNAYYASHNDHLGRPEMLTNSAKAVVFRAKNDAFGRTSVTDTIGGLNIGFPGQYFDIESGLWQNWHRTYDSQTGRYLQSDPLGLAAGANLYSYVDAKVLYVTDSLGLEGGKSPTQWCTWCGAPHGGLFGDYCPDCESKSRSPTGGVPPNPSSDTEEKPKSCPPGGSGQSSELGDDSPKANRSAPSPSSMGAGIILFLYALFAFGT
jgi:RHS repeat-associated protein